MSTLNVALVRAADGSIDQDASTDAFRSALIKHVAELETEQAQIATVVSGLFDSHLGARINMPALTSMACNKLNAQPENYTVLAERVQDYVRSNAQGEVKDKVEANPTSLYVIGKGKGGGVARRADLKKEEASK